MDGQPAPEGVDPNVPNVARMYDYYLDGKQASSESSLIASC